MSWTIQATVVNAQQVIVEVPIEVDGEPATARFARALIEAIPADKAGKTVTVSLPPDAAEAIAEGATLNITIEVAEA
jgi:hypothetical protein